jgi:hypothetical protein
VANVFSRSFCQQVGVSGGPFTVYTVPAGKLALIKNLVITWGDVSLSGLDAWYQTDTPCKLWRRTASLVPLDPQQAGGSDGQFGSWVLVAGQELQVQTAAGTVDFFSAGYELDLP